MQHDWLNDPSWAPNVPPKKYSEKLPLESVAQINEVCSISEQNFKISCCNDHEISGWFFSHNKL